MVLVVQNGSVESDHLIVVDSRTSKTYTIPITNNTVKATDFEAIKTGRPEYDDNTTVGVIEEGLKLFDLGFKNTACLNSNVSYM